MTEMLLLGAGASVEAGVPASEAMVSCMLSEFRKRPALHEQVPVVQGLIDSLRDAATSSGDKRVNIEDVINAAYALSDYEKGQSDLRYFVAAMNSVVEELSAASSRLQFTMDNFQAVAQQMQKLIVPVTWIRDRTCIDYLSPILTLAEQQGKLTIASLNYDNSIELLAEKHSFPCTTGIIEWGSTGVFHTDREGINLLKLHGSSDWEEENPDGYADGSVPAFYLDVRQVDEDDVLDTIASATPSYIPAILLGGRNKLTAEGPFLDLLYAFRTALEQADVLTIIGYSFADEHINHSIARWINGSPDRRIRIIKPSRLDLSASPQLLRDFSRMSPDRLCHIAATTSEGLKELYK